jgi:hypothetical protein
MARWPVTEAREEKAEAEGEGEEKPDAQVHTWPAWRGSARAADQARPREVFTGGGVVAQGAPVGDASTCAAQPPKHHAANTGRRSGEVSSSKATRAGETRAGSSSGSPPRGGVFQIYLVGRKRTQRRAFGPRWRQRRTPEVAGIAERRRGDLGSPEREFERERERSVWGRMGWVGLTDLDPSRLGSTSQVGWVRSVG